MKLKDSRGQTDDTINENDFLARIAPGELALINL